MAKQRPYQITILTPVKDAITSVRKQARLSTGKLCHDLICVRAQIVNNDGIAPSYVRAQVFKEDVEHPSPTDGAHEGDIGGPWDGYNCRWDHQGGSEVDSVPCKDKPEFPPAWLIVWARWGEGGQWQEVEKVKFFGKRETKTECQ